MTKLLQVLIAAGILSVSLLVSNVYAYNCAVDCGAPTIGVKHDGQRVVDNGLAINGRTFQVENKIQSIPTMQLHTGDSEKITLTVYEFSGTAALRHASIAISDYKDDKNRSDLAMISFDQDFTGKKTTNVIDHSGVLKDVSVNAVQLDQWRTEITYSFKPVKPFDAKALIVDLWDEDSGSATNVFLNALKTGGKEIVQSVPVQPKHVASPLKQVSDGVAPKNVECRAGLELVFRVTGGPLCVYPITADTLRVWGLIE